jgi:Ran GTPase-activating protein (RanGAP) involved in mRNA processing and transport
LNALNENFSLSNLSLASNNLDNVCISAISLFLEKNETLKSIDLSCNVVTDLGAKSLGFSMLQNYTVINMNLRNNVLSTNLYDEMIKRYCSRNLQLRYYLTRLEFCRVMQFKCPHIDKYIVTSLIFPMTFQ